MDPDGNRQFVFGPDSKGAGFQHEFDLTDFPENEESIFTIVVTAKDPEDLETELRLKARILHDPPEVPTGIFQQEKFIEYGFVFYIFPALFIILVGAYLGMISYINMKNYKDKKGKMDLLDKKKKEEDKSKESSAIEEEFVSRMQKDSRKYLEQTGAGKGREEFAKELQAAQEKPGLPQDDQQKLPPASPQEPAAQTPPKPAEPQAAQQPPAQAAPPLQQPPAPAAPPQQAPPVPSTPAQQQPPVKPAPQPTVQRPPPPAVRPPVPGTPAPQRPPMPQQATPAPPKAPPVPPKVPPKE
jgi:hypothetical protein